MSRVLKSEKLNGKKQANQALPSNATVKKKVPLKKQTALKISTHTNDSSPLSDEKERKTTKLPNAASTISNNKARVVADKTQLQGKKQGTKLVQQNVSSNLQTLRAKQLSSIDSTKIIRESSQKRTLPTDSSTVIVKKPAKKQNAALDTPHNVTVCSPPPKKRDQQQNDYQNTDKSKLSRKVSRTLAPDEIVILKRESAKVRSEEKIPKEHLQTESTVVTGLKESVAFEIKFEEKAVKKRSISRENVGVTENDEELSYSDDFDSYESDFESDSSTHSLTEPDPPSSDNNDVSNLLEEEYENGKVSENVVNKKNGSLNQRPSGGESGHKDDAITEILKDKERKLDSGNYDMNSRKTNGNSSSDMCLQFTQPKVDSLETFSLGISEQLDSGISTRATSIPASYNRNIREITYGGYKDFYTKPIINRRGSELMTKIQLDVLSFTLIDLKPISYDIFMQTFGKLNTNQVSTQTKCNHINVEQQTETPETRSIWTQHPAQFYFEIDKSFDQMSYNPHCCGEMTNECRVQILSNCSLQQSLNELNQLSSETNKRNYQNYQKKQTTPINYQHLNSFLLRSSLLIDQILGSSHTRSGTKYNPIRNPAYENDQAMKRVWEKSFRLDINLLNALQVLKLFSNNKYNLLVTVHESLPDTNVYSSDFTNILMVWCTNTCDKPLRLLTTWSQVSKVEISNDSSDIIVAALRDGSIALWDLRETHSFCSKLDGCLTHFAATQSLIPSWCGEKSDSKLIMDLGACLDVKSFRSHSNSMLIQTKFPKTQFVSLHECGIVTVWTLVETSEISYDLLQYKNNEKLKFTPTFEYTSPWARVKLLQSSIVNIKEYLETRSHQSQSRFDKTKTLFQKNIYNDEALKELNEFTSDMGQQGLRFTSLECGSENIFICTNRNYILMCSRTLKMAKLKRIMINESPLLFPTALKVLSSEHFLAVGLSNGVVMILNCQDGNFTQSKKITETSTLLESDTQPNLKDNLAGKSCAIQNILLNVRKTCEDIDFDREYRPSTAACISLIDSKKKPFEVRIFDQQVILNGSVLRKNLIQSLELSSDGWYLFALANGQVRIYDFYLDQEIPYEETQQTSTVTDIATGKCGRKENNLMLLKPNQEVVVYILNK